MRIPAGIIISGLLLAGPATVAAQSDTLPDPTRPAEYAGTLAAQQLPATVADWKVTAIRISDKDRSAIINGHIVRAGDNIGTAAVLEILPYQVVLDYDNRKVVVRLFGDINPRKPATDSIKTENKS